MTNGLSEQITLNSSYSYDSVLCGCVADVDFDGKNEIILGTYGQVSMREQLPNDYHYEGSSIM